jgi:hypothetical protein
MRSNHAKKRFGIRGDWSRGLDVPFRLAVVTLAFSGRCLNTVSKFFLAARRSTADDGSTQTGGQAFDRRGGSEGTGS